MNKAVCPLNIVPKYIVFLFKYYLLSLVFLFLFRCVLFVQYNMEHVDGTFLGKGVPITAFKIGFQFDSVVLSYIMLIPFLFLTVASFIKIKPAFYKWTHYYLSALLAIVFLIGAADVPYFNYNFSRMSVVAFSWLSDVDIVIGMIAAEKSYFLYILLFLGLYLPYFFLTRRILKRTLKQGVQSAKQPIVLAVAFVIVGFFLFLGVRGRIDSPIRINHAFYCNNSFYNQLGLNPVFVLIKSSIKNNAIHVIDDEAAVQEAVRLLVKDVDANSSYHSPIAREVQSDRPEIKKNIVLVLMESMSANKLARFGNTHHLTPFLDSLAANALSFDHIYSAGFHTCNGIFSTLYSFPTILRERPMSSVDHKRFSSIPKVLKDKGYTNLYFTSHSETFDNIGGFLPYNYFDRIVSQKDYDPAKVQSTFGVPDHVLFEYVLEKLDSTSMQSQPFFATVMTVSDHGPYIIPSNIDFVPHNQDIKQQIVEYADWSIQQFMHQAKTKKWYDNTLFVFVADHGVIMDEVVYDIPRSLHHVPLIMYSADTNLIRPDVCLNYGGQIDVLPTVMGLLNMSYLNNTFGVDLFRESRPYAYFSADDKLACVNDSLLYIYNTRGKKELLYKYRTLSTDNIISRLPKEAADMKKYLFSMVQASKWIITQNKTTEKAPDIKP